MSDFREVNKDPECSILSACFFRHLFPQQAVSEAARDHAAPDDSMSAYLEEHLPHLQSLHAQLALPATALSSDQARLESAIRNAVTALVREREEEVDRWREAIDGEKKELSSVAKALGEMGRNVLAATRRDSLEDEVGRQVNT